MAAAGAVVLSLIFVIPVQIAVGPAGIPPRRRSFYPWFRTGAAAGRQGYKAPGHAASGCDGEAAAG